MAELNNYKTTENPLIPAVTQQRRGASSPDARTSPDKGLGLSNAMMPQKVHAPADMQPVEKTRNKKDKSSPNKKASTGDQQNSHESDSFYKMYNKEIKVNQDEIPIILAELTDAAHNFIQRENYEKALILLQKTEGVLEVVSLDGCTRDKYISFITYNNMAMCFQKLGMLDECIIYLKGSIQQIQDEKFYKKRRLAKRSRRLRQECKLKLQLCAIMSQTQNHSEALDNARKAVKLSHQLFKDMEELSQVYIDKINFKENLQAAQEQSDLEDDERDHIIQLILDSSPAKKLPKTFLEQSISLAERLSIKMCPVIKEVRKRLVGAPALEKKKGEEGDLDRVLMPKNKDANLSVNAITAIGMDTSAIEGQAAKDPKAEEEDEDDDLEEEKPDMRSVLGFLNQNEWIFNLNIGNIMQIQPITMKDLLSETNDELELSRDVFLENLSILTVSYFCMSTEMRFLLQSRANFLKPEVKRDRELESEYWHAKALEIACTFLPSECPLLNHVLLSYQKHHDPSMQPIKEDEESSDVLQVLRPLKGIENSKYQPIIRNLPNLKVHLSPTSYKTLLADADEFELFVKEKPQFYQPQIMHADQLQAVGSDKLQPLIASKSIEQIPQDPRFVPMMPPQRVPPEFLEQLNQVTMEKILKLKSPLVDEHEYPDEDKAVDANDIAVEILNAKADSITEDDKLAQQVHNVHMGSDQLNPIEWDLPKSAGQSPDSYSKMHGNLLKEEGGIQDQLSKINQEMGKISTSNNEISASIEELFDKQIFDGDETPDRNNESKDLNDTGDSQLYDKIIQKIIDNPKIDKRTLVQKFISRIEMEQNVGATDELNQIKKLAKRFAKEKDGKFNEDAEQFYSDEEPEKFNPMRSTSEDQLQANSSVDQVPQESSGVFHIGLKNLVQVTSNVPNSNNLQASRGGKSGSRKQGSAKAPGYKKTTQDASKQRKTPSMLKPQVMDLPTKTNKTAPNHNLSHHDSSTAQAVSSAEINLGKKKHTQKRDAKVSQSIPEQDSFFKDIEKTSDRQGASAISDKHCQHNVFESAEHPIHEANSQKSPPTKGQKLEKQRGRPIAKQRVSSGDNRNSSERKLSSQSRPNSTCLSHPTRASSAFLKHKKRSTLLANQVGLNEKQMILKQTNKRQTLKSKSHSSSSGKRRVLRARANDSVLQGNSNSNQQLKRVDYLKVDKSKENIQQNSQISRKLSQQKTQRNVHKKRPSNQQDMTLKDRPVSSMAMIHKPNHNTSQQSHHLDIDRSGHLKTLQKGYQKRHNFSQTKFVCNQKPKDLLSRRRKTLRKNGSVSKSSGKKNSNSGSTKKSKSKSLGSEQNRMLQNELGQQSFDIQMPENYFSKKNQTTDVRRNNPANQSLVELQRQVLENQKMLIGMLRQQRSASGDSSRHPSGERKKSKGENSQPQLKSKNVNLILQAQLQDHAVRLRNQSQQSDSHIIELANQKQFHSHSTLARSKRKANQNSISQQVSGVSKIINPASIAPQTQTSGSASDNQRRMNKTLIYLRQLQSGGGRKTEDLKNRHADASQFQQNLINEVNQLKSKMQEQLILAHQRESPARNNSNSQKRSNERKRSNSRSPSQPTRAKIPKVSGRQLVKIQQQKNFEKFESQAQFLRASLPLGLQKSGNQSASVNQILNCSGEDIAKLIVSNDSEFDAKQAKAFNSVLPQRILLKAKKIQMQSKAVPGLGEDPSKFNDLQESTHQDKQRVLRVLAEGKAGPIVGEPHTLSIFDSELDLSNNKQNSMQMPHHQSHHEIVKAHFKSSKGEGLTPKNNRLRGNFSTNPNYHSMSMQQPESKHLNQTRRAVSKKVLKKVFDRQSATQSVLQQQKLITAQNAVKQLIR